MSKVQPAYLPLVAAGLLLSSTLTSSAFSVEEPQGTGSFSIDEWNEEQFRKGFGFRIKVDASQLHDDELRSHLAGLSIPTKSGGYVKALDYSREHDVLIGTVAENTDISFSLVKKTGEGTHFVVAARDRSTGKFQVLKPEDIAVVTLDGNPIPFSLKPFNEVRDIKVSLAVLIDRSGSMSGYLDEAKQALTEFGSALPGNAQCMLLSFNHTYSDHLNGFDDCDKAADSIAHISAVGGTDIFTPLLYSFQRLGQLEDHLRMVVIVTDGADHSDISEHEVLKHKNVPVTVLWRGWWSNAKLKTIADAFIAGSDNFEALIKRYLGSIKHSINGQYVVTIKAPPQSQFEEAKP